MRQKEKQNQICSLPVYALCLIIIAAVGVWYFFRPKEKVQPADQAINGFLDHQNKFLSLSDVVRSRSTWQPLLTSSVGQQIEDFEFADISGKKHRLSDFAGGPVIAVLWATWSPACTMQLKHWKELRLDNPGLIIIAFSSESQESLERYTKINKDSLMLVRQQEALSKPLSDVSDIPAAFFIDQQGKLFLAAKGIIPLEHADAILRFMEPKASGKTSK